MKTDYIFAGAIILGIVIIDQVFDLADGLTDVNQGTPFEDTGIVGTLGNVTDQASGGILSRFGSFLGGKAADLREKILGLDEL